MESTKLKILPYIIGFSALAVSGSAAFYSVSGLSKLFAGASLEVIIMAGSLEVAKLVIASLLYQYWTKLNKILRTYLTIATVVLVLITSMGIYGFLSAAYQETYAELSITENKKEFLSKKADFYKKDVERYDKELEQVYKNISTLSNAKATSIQVKDTSVQGGVRNTISTAELRLARERIKEEELNKKEIQAKKQLALDSIQKYELEVLTLENKSDKAGELGPLKYLAKLTGQPMDRIINWLLLVIIFVFDPLAISLVVAANFAFTQASNNKKTESNITSEKLKKMSDTLDKNLREDFGDIEGLEEDLWNTVDSDIGLEVVMDKIKENEKEQDIIQDADVDEVLKDIEEKLESSSRTKKSTKLVDRVLQKGPSKWRVKFTDGTQGWVNKPSKGNDENKITYMS